MKIVIDFVFLNSKSDFFLYVQEVKKFENIDQLEEFMLKHGETIVDMLGGEIDRIEMKLRVRIFCNICINFSDTFSEAKLKNTDVLYHVILIEYLLDIQGIFLVYSFTCDPKFGSKFLVLFSKIS